MYHPLPLMQGWCADFWDRRARACLKIAFRQLCVPLCGRFGPDEGGVAGYVDRIGTKYTAKWGGQMVGMNFQTRSRAARRPCAGLPRISHRPWIRRTFMANIIEITDFSAPELDIYARLTEGQLLNRHEPEKGIFIAESPKVIERALDAGCVPISLLMETKHAGTQAREIIRRCGEVPVYTAEFHVLTQLTGFHLTRGMLCAMYRPQLPGLEDICAGARRIAVLEDVMNPTNIGAVFRSAAALGMDAVLLTAACSNPLYRRAIRVSMGTVFQIPWTILDSRSSWPGPGISRLRALGFKTAAMALSDDSISIDDARLTAEGKLALILGTEGDGLSQETIADCDYTVRIPMSHGVDSLNVAAASAVAFWQVGRPSREDGEWGK